MSPKVAYIRLDSVLFVTKSTIVYDDSISLTSKVRDLTISNAFRLFRFIRSWTAKHVILHSYQEAANSNMIPSRQLRRLVNET